MVKLTNIVRNGNTISCTIYPEDSTEPGSIAVDIEKEEIIESTLPVGYENCRMHLAHAMWALLDMVKSGDIREKRTVMWY